MFSKQVVGHYCEASGQSINFSKSAIYFGKDVDVRIHKEISRTCYLCSFYALQVLEVFFGEYKGTALII